MSPDAALAAAVIDPKAIKVTERGVKFVTTKSGGCPAADVLGTLGSCRPAKGSFCIIDFTGFLPNGEVFDSTEKKGGKPLAFKLGARQVIAGFEEVVAEMLPGEEVQAFIPAALAYGSKGVCTAPSDDGAAAPPPAADDGAAAAEGAPPAAGECLIPPNTNLKYFIRLKTVSAPPP